MTQTNVMKSNNGRILFVEDEKMLTDMYHLYFEKNGYDFLCTADIAEALEITRFEQPDVVLLDIIIPKEENGVINLIAEQGWDYLEAAKKDPKIKKIPVIVFTNLDTMKDRVKSANLGAIAYIFKGKADPKDVIKTIDEVIKQTKEKKK